MLPIRAWLGRAPATAPALILPGGARLSYGDLAARPGRSGLEILAGDSTELACGLIETALGGGTAFPLSPLLNPTQRARLIELARKSATPSLALFIATSGSTGKPKGVRLPWRAVAAAA